MFFFTGVPSADLENNSSQKKYTVNRGSSGDISISRPVCALFVMGALLLAAVAAVITYFLVPGCDGNSLPESLTRSTQRILNDPTATDELTSKYVRLPRTLEPTHYRSVFIQIARFMAKLQPSLLSYMLDKS